MKLFSTILAAICLWSPALSQATEKDEVQQAASTIEHLSRIPERGIPESIMRNAKGVAIVRVYKAGFGFSGQVGRGVVVARTKQGWSGPTFISMVGPGFGPQIGLKSTDYVLVLNTQQAVAAFSRGANVTLGGSLSAAVGPAGRTFGLDVTPRAAIYTYSQSHGLFVGASLDGTVVSSRPNAIARFYGQPEAPSRILAGTVPPPPAAEPLQEALEGPRRLVRRPRSVQHQNR